VLGFPPPIGRSPQPVLNRSDDPKTHGQLVVELLTVTLGILDFQGHTLVLTGEDFFRDASEKSNRGFRNRFLSYFCRFAWAVAAQDNRIVPLLD
jgi:hypothetical protein